MMESIENNKRINAGRFSILYDLYIDLLGSLVPGLFSVIIGGTIIFLAFVSIYSKLFNLTIFSNKLINVSSVISALAKLLGSLHWELSIVTVITAYIVGTIFFRQDPKKPDAASALYVWINSKKKERPELAVQSTKTLPPYLELFDPEDKPKLFARLRSTLRIGKFTRDLGLDTQFPYLYLRCYLAARGLTHLLRFIPWCPSDKNTHSFRTKMFINILKIRLTGLFPDLSTDIVRNEAHVRLATSVWYASSALILLSIFVITCLILILFSITHIISFSILISLIPSLITVIFCVSLKIYLNKCIHYMRVREVIYVLEAANMAEIMRGEKLFNDLIEKDYSNKCLQCETIKLKTVNYPFTTQSVIKSRLNEKLI